MSDVFNNPSNKYVDPGLAPCSNISDSYAFRIIDNNAVVTNGNEVLEKLNLNDLSVSINDWASKRVFLKAGEVVYIPGLSKGLSTKKQFFNIPNFGALNQKYYMAVDASISYYDNFSSVIDKIDASANWASNLDIDDAVNIELSKTAANLNFSYDPSYFTIEGNQAGQEFEVNSMELTLIDASLDQTSPFPTMIDPSTGDRIPQVYNLSQNIELEQPALIYPNGAMLGYVIKNTFPADKAECSKWIYMNNVYSPYIIYEEADASLYTDPSILYEKNTKKVDVGRNEEGTDNVISAMEYLNYVNTNNLWNKVGAFSANITANDSPICGYNSLIGGFYLYNPHNYTMQVEYLIINR